MSEKGDSRESNQEAILAKLNKLYIAQESLNIELYNLENDMVRVKKILELLDVKKKRIDLKAAKKNTKLMAFVEPILEEEKELKKVRRTINVRKKKIRQELKELDEKIQKLVNPHLRIRSEEELKNALNAAKKRCGFEGELTEVVIKGGLPNTYLYFSPSVLKKIHMPKTASGGKGTKRLNAARYLRFYVKEDKWLGKKGHVEFYVCPLCGIVQGTPWPLAVEADAKKALRKGLGGDYRLICRRCLLELSSWMIESDEYAEEKRKKELRVLDKLIYYLSERAKRIDEAEKKANELGL